MNNKGFAVTTLIYGLAIMMLLLIAIIMAILSSMRRNMKDLSDEIENELLVASEGTVEYTGYSNDSNEEIYTVPQGGTGYYRIEVWAPSSAGQNGYYASGVVKLLDSQQLVIHRGQKDTTDNIAYLSYTPYKSSSSVDMNNTRVLYVDNRVGMMIGSPDYYGRLFTTSTDKHSFSYFYTHDIPQNFFLDTLIIPNTFAADDYAKVSIRRILLNNESLEITPYNYKTWINSNTIRIRSSSYDLKNCTMYYTYQESRHLEPNSTDCSVFSDIPNTICNHASTDNGDYVIRMSGKAASLSLVCPDSEEIKNTQLRIMLNGSPKNASATDETTNYNIIYDGKYRYNHGRGIELSQHQLDSIADKPDHGDFYILAADDNRYALTTRNDGLSVGMELLGERDTQRWAIDKVCNYNLNTHECVSTKPNGTTVDKVYRIVELTSYNALDIKLDENIEGNEITAQYNYNALSLNEPQLWRLIPNKDGTYSIKSVVAPQNPSDTDKLGFVSYDEGLTSSTIGDNHRSFNLTIGKTDDKNKIKSNQKFRLFSYDYSIKDD